MSGPANSLVISGADSVTKCLPQVTRWFVPQGGKCLDETIYLLYQYLVIAQEIQYLENNIRRVITEIQPDFLIKEESMKIASQDCGTCAVAQEATCQKSYLNIKWPNVIFVRRSPLL